MTAPEIKTLQKEHDKLKKTFFKEVFNLWLVMKIRQNQECCPFPLDGFCPAIPNEYKSEFQSWFYKQYKGKFDIFTSETNKDELIRFKNGILPT